MEDLIARQFAAFDRVVDFGANHPLIPAIPAVTTLLGDLDVVLTSLIDWGDDQAFGRGQFRGGSAFRQSVAEEVRALMRPINKIARALKPAQHPGVREQFRMPSSGSHSALIAGAEAFVAAATPIKQLFVDRGLPATFDTELTAKKTALVAATGQKNAGQAMQMAGTAGLLAQSRVGLDLLRELDAILSYQYRNDPALLAAWKGACRVERDPVTETQTPAAPAPAPTA
jgi:hypothetical protein